MSQQNTVQIFDANMGQVIRILAHFKQLKPADETERFSLEMVANAMIEAGHDVLQRLSPGKNNWLDPEVVPIRDPPKQEEVERCPDCGSWNRTTRGPIYSHLIPEKGYSQFCTSKWHNRILIEMAPQEKAAFEAWLDLTKASSSVDYKTGVPSAAKVQYPEEESGRC